MLMWFVFHDFITCICLCAIIDGCITDFLWVTGEKHDYIVLYFFVFQVEEEELISTDSKCKDYLIEALKYHLYKGDKSRSLVSPRTRLRTPVGLPKVCTHDC